MATDKRFINPFLAGLKWAHNLIANVDKLRNVANPVCAEHPFCRRRSPTLHSSTARTPFPILLRKPSQRRQKVEQRG